MWNFIKTNYATSIRELCQVTANQLSLFNITIKHNLALLRDKTWKLVPISRKILLWSLVLIYSVEKTWKGKKFTCTTQHHSYFKLGALGSVLHFRRKFPVKYKLDSSSFRGQIQDGVSKIWFLVGNLVRLKFEDSTNEFGIELFKLYRR
jgi:hypothetical protein